MSQSTNAVSGQFRLRAARLGETSLRERLALVPPRARRRTRMPFAVLIALILATGVTGLLMFNTHMQQGAFEIERLQNQAAALSAQQQDESMQVLRLSDPQHLAAAARRLGMVVPTNPTFLDLATGRILGMPTPATRANAMDIGGAGIAPTPQSLRPPPKIVIVQPKKTTDTAKTKADSGAATPGSGTSAGKNN